ncbi:AMP-binding protein [Arthrobacter sp. ISL-5]|uniref:AMP-binding protein n=1 Tax=Arthrobacter sp. ISL-5 TaxID=2819111 RepID=UPI001BEABA5E|nr:AMP-binding protein [Arthrobacter sp. ISL-5]MBT2554147.1 AMP-binding protein [Arthrobacter sp. ISL-5]
MDSTLFTDIQRLYLAEDATAAWLLCDRHDPSATAYTLVDGDSARPVSYGELRADSIRLANAFRQLGVEPGTRVATLVHKGPELVATMLAVWRLGAVYVPLFTAFAGKAIDYRIRTAGVRLVLTDTAQRSKLPDFAGSEAQVVVVDGKGQPGDIDYGQLVAAASDEQFDSYVQGPDGPLVHIFTSGTTGSPKGVIHPLRQATGWHSYLVYGLGVTDEDVYWCAADPGWAYGLYAGIVSPLALGSGVILQSGSFNPATAWKLIEEQGVTNLTAAPTVYRALRNVFPTVPSKGKLRRLSSAGEPLTPEVNVWATAELGLQVHDHFGQTEVGMVFGNAHHPDIARDIVPGSMGYPLPGWAATVIGENDATELATGELGRVAIDVMNSPAMTFRSYQDPSKTASRFDGDGRYYLLGDLGHRDAHGAFHFASRDDDVIIMAGYRIGPFEIESMLSEHPAVAESAAIAAPDADRGEVLEAFVVLSDGWEATEALEKELQTFVKTNYAAHAYPRAIHFVTDLPKTPSGKIQRYVLREQRRSEPEKAGQQ